MSSRVALGLGANLGDRLAALQTAVDIICQDPQVTPIAVSPVFQTKPVGGPAQPDYLNAVLLVHTQLAPLEVLALTKLAEFSLGRTRKVRWDARTLDADVLSYDDRISDDPVLTLPHPRVAQRAFVLVPWASVDREYVLPGSGQTVAQLLAALDLDEVANVRPADVGVLHLPGHTL